MRKSGQEIAVHDVIMHKEELNFLSPYQVARFQSKLSYTLLEKELCHLFHHRWLIQVCI